MGYQVYQKMNEGWRQIGDLLFLDDASRVLERQATGYIICGGELIQTKGNLGI